jgi:preprotein translocase subunit YajC
MQALKQGDTVVISGWNCGFTATVVALNTGRPGMVRIATGGETFEVEAAHCTKRESK